MFTSPNLPAIQYMMRMINYMRDRYLIRYIDAVFPGEYGIPKPFYFFLTPSYWLGRPIGQVKSFTAGSSLEVSYLVTVA